jgi:hypothetical protein
VAVDEDAAAAAAVDGGELQDTTREFGSALGVAVIRTIVTSRFAASTRGAHTVPQALAGPGRRAVLAAFAASASASLQVMGRLTLAAGAIVIGQSVLRRPGNAR